MATILLKAALRPAFSKSVLEKRVAPTLCSFLLGAESNGRKKWPTMNFQHCEMVGRMYSKRNVHHTRSSTSLSAETDSDSDGEFEGRGQSAFWRQKMRTLHSHLDVNKDGVISYDDFMLLGERFSDLGHLTEDAKKEFRRVLTDMWKEQWGDVSPYNSVCVETYLEEMTHVLNDESLKKKCHNFLPFLFKAVDKDQSGEITVEEFKLFFECLGLTRDHAVVSFSHIDINDDGKISLQEFVTLGRNFFLTEDRTCPSKHFWGPLVD